MIQYKYNFWQTLMEYNITSGYKYYSFSLSCKSKFKLYYRELMDMDH